MSTTPLAAVASPCINVCQMQPRTGWCAGCMRTLDEIAAWGQLDDAAKRMVLAQLPPRRLRARQLLAARRAEGSDGEPTLPPRQP